MAKDVVIHTWCDRHLQLDERVVGKELPPVTLGGMTLTLDLCEPCVKEFVTPLVELLDQFGAPPQTSPVARRGKGKGTDRGLACIWCPADFSANTSSGYMNHIRTIHGYGSAIDAFGTMCPICGDSGLRMMMAHVKKRHPDRGFTHTSQAVLWAKDNGDPFGVYAATLNRVPSLTPEVRGQYRRLAAPRPGASR